MNKKRLVVGTRSSQLALWQADHVIASLRQLYPDIEFEKKLITTKGDKILDAPLAKIGGKGLFTKELETAMLRGEIDFAVHSLKDMPTELPEGLTITAMTKREEPWDAFVSNKYNSLEELPAGARVGTSSLRRRAQILNKRPDLELLDLRGNVNTRLKKLDEGEYDAIILAAAGLKRLGLGNRIKELLDLRISLPAVGQGILAIECVAENMELRRILASLEDKASFFAARAERSFLAEVQGGCQVPVGVFAQLTSIDVLEIEAMIASVDGQMLLRERVTGKPEEAEELGRSLAQQLLNRGGREILQALGC